MRLTTPQPVRLNPKLENMRVRHAQKLTRLMLTGNNSFEGMSLYQKKKLIQELKEDLIEFDTYFLSDKYVLKEDKDEDIFVEKPGKRDFVYVCLDTRIGYSSIGLALSAAGGMGRNEFSKMLFTVNETDKNGRSWRKIRNDFDYYAIN